MDNIIDKSAMLQEEPACLHNGEIYDPNMPEIQKMQMGYMDDLDLYNKMCHSDIETRRAKLKELLAECGEGCYVETPFRANFGGKHVHFGSNIYVNSGCTFVDDTHIYVGDCCQFGPNVIVATAAHPTDPALREKGLQFNKPVHIGRNCWIGAGSIILPGVTIGENTTIGAGSVVTKDIPANVVAVGNPCRVIRTL